MTPTDAVAERRHFLGRLAIIVAVALAWRLLYVRLELPFRIVTDEDWFVAEAHNLVNGHPWTNLFFPGGPTAEHAPLTSIVLAPFAWLFPHAHAGLRDVMAVVGAGTVAVLGMAGRVVGGSRAGLVAATVAAAFPDFWIRDGLAVSEPLAAFLVALAVWVTLEARRRPRPWHPLALGALAGLVCLTRPEMVLAVLVLGVVVVQRGPWARRLVAVALVVGTTAIVLAPWVAYNQGRFKESVLVSNNLGITLAGANCQRTYYDLSIMGYDSRACWTAAYQRAEAKSADESVQSRLMRDEALRFVAHHLDRVPLVMVMREAWFLGLYRPGWSVHIGVKNGQPSWATWCQALVFYVVLLATIVLWWRHRRRPWPHWVIAVLLANSLVVAALFVGHWRYRITMDVGIVLVLALAMGVGDDGLDPAAPSAEAVSASAA